MKVLRTGMLCALILGLSAWPALSSASPIPEFTHGTATEWINSAPLSLARLRGKVVLLEFWTFDCINCLRTLAWVKDVHSRLAGSDFVVIGVHTPELPEERPADNVRAAVRRLGVNYPVMLDADSSYWNAIGNRYWPAFYLIDRDGSLSSQTIGEVHAGDSTAVRMEASIRNLLAVSPQH